MQPRKASAIITNLVDLARALVLKPHVMGDDMLAHIAMLSAEMKDAGDRDPSGRGQFLREAGVLATCLNMMIERRRSLQAKETDDPEHIREFERAVVPFITFAAERGVDAVRYEIAEGVL